MACDARQESDEMACACGLRWNVNDPEPPQCRRQRHVEPGKVPPIVREALRADANYVFTSGARDPFPDLDNTGRRFYPFVRAHVPLELPTPLAGRMITAYERAIDAGENNQTAMRAAYRIFLDALPA